MSVSSCSGHWLGWNQLQDGRSIDCVHAAGGTEDMDPIDCNGHTYIGRRAIPSSTSRNEQFPPCCRSYLAPSTVKLPDEFGKNIFESVFWKCPAVECPCRSDSGQTPSVPLHCVALVTALAFARRRDCETWERCEEKMAHRQSSGFV